MLSKLRHFELKKYEYQYISLYCALMAFITWFGLTQPNVI